MIRLDLDRVRWKEKDLPWRTGIVFSLDYFFISSSIAFCFLAITRRLIFA